MVRSIMKGPWLIGYEVQKNKVIRLIHSSKALEPRGWTYGEGNDNIRIS